ncbi:MAG TPA: glucoamylase family protein [Hanamia sp.]|nr:glucoamylase family protein [Hanamia sp.]
MKTAGGEDVLYRHGSLDYGRQMNFPILGCNECLSAYILAASSPTHDVPSTVYREGWAALFEYGWQLYMKYRIRWR